MPSATAVTPWLRAFSSRCARHLDRRRSRFTRSLLLWGRLLPGRWLLPGLLLLTLLFGRRPDHAFELHAVWIGEIDRVIIAAVIFAWRIDDIHGVVFQEGAERVDILAACKLERIVMKADVAFAVFPLPALVIRGRDPQQRLAVAPARHVGVVVFELEAEEFEEL